MKQDLLCNSATEVHKVCVLHYSKGVFWMCAGVSIFFPPLTRSAVIYGRVFAGALAADVIVSLFFLAPKDVSMVVWGAVIYFAWNNQVKGFYFVAVPSVIFLKVVCVCACVCMHRRWECHLHLFIRMFPTGRAVMRPVEPRSDGVELIRRERETERETEGDIQYQERVGNK